MTEKNSILANAVAQIMEELAKRKRRCVIVYGHIGSGKTLFAGQLATALDKQGVKVGGIVSPRILDEGKTVGYRVQDIETSEEQLLATLHPLGIPIGKFYLSEKVLGFAQVAIERAASTAQVVILDEVGRLELEGEGHANALRILLQSEAIAVLFIRTMFVEPVTEKFGIDDYLAFHVT